MLAAGFLLRPHTGRSFRPTFKILLTYMADEEGADLTSALIGGCFVGSACGSYMLLGGHIAGSSGHMKALIVGPREANKIAYLLGMVMAAIVFSFALPDVFEQVDDPKDVLAYTLLVVGGIANGFGTNLGGGCTSGHGLCGISRLSLRSMVATPTFLLTAAVTATLSHGIPWPPTLLPIIPPCAAKLTAAWYAVAGLAPLYILLGVLAGNPGGTSQSTRELVLGGTVGLTFGIGLCIGGMIRPSVVIHALTPAPFDLTLWVLFMSALAVTFGLYRLAACLGVDAASLVCERDIDAAKAPGATVASVIAGWASPQLSSVDRRLLIGEVMFGVGWGLTGFCPGPLLVGFVGSPQLTPFVVLAAFCVGMVMASSEAGQKIFAPAMV